MMATPAQIAAAQGEWQVLREHMLAEYPDLDETTLNDTLDGETGILDMVTRLILDAEDDLAMATALRLTINERQERRERIEARADKRRQIAQTIMAAIGVRNLERPEFTASIRATPPAVIVHDPECLPDDLCRHKREPDKAKIKAALQAGLATPGAYLSNGSESLSVRTR